MDAPYLRMEAHKCSGRSPRVRQQPRISRALYSKLQDAWWATRCHAPTIGMGCEAVLATPASRLDLRALGVAKVLSEVQVQVGDNASLAGHAPSKRFTHTISVQLHCFAMKNYTDIIRFLGLHT